jgi:predicted ArsR family transcriptional regulator
VKAATGQNRRLLAPSTKGRAREPAHEPAHESAHEPGGAHLAAAISAMTAALGDPTRREIYLHARERPSVTAAEVALQFGLHPNVARHHLDRLAAAGYLTVTLEHPHRGAGRPAKHYRAGGPPGDAPVLDALARRDDLLVALLVAALDRLGPADAEALAEEVGETYAKALAGKMAPGEGQRSLRSALQVVAEALTAHGFAARAEQRGESAYVISESCPFGSAASEHPVICAVDRGLIRGLLSCLCAHPDEAGSPVLISSRARGDDSCVASV